jgi:hypothetical protein
MNNWTTKTMNVLLQIEKAQRIHHLPCVLAPNAALTKEEFGKARRLPCLRLVKWCKFSVLPQLH